MISMLFAGIIFLFAGFIQGLTGFGSALVAIPLLSFVFDIKTAVPLCMLNGVVITTYMALNLRRDLDVGKILPLLFGALPGILVGIYLLKHGDESMLRHGIGVLLIGYSLYNLVTRPKPINPGKAWGYVAGFLTGAIGAAISAGGPPAIIYTTLTSWSKEEIKATLTGFFIVNGYITASLHAITGITGMATLKIFAVTVGFVLLGTIIGSKVSGR
ncbi:sulfite exporter TauE/SafE family protein, partial [Desulfovulcanus sp.]